MGNYISVEDVKLRLAGKVSFDASTGSDENRMSAFLAASLIDQAEGEVELELSLRYLAPFQNDFGAGFASLAARPTQMVIKTLCLNKACIYILNTDFGRGSIVGGEEYCKGLQKQYDTIADRLLLLRGEKERGDGNGQDGSWKYPPLPGLALNYQNTSDDGFMGQIYHSTQGGGSYAGDSVNDPALTFWNATVRDIAGAGTYNPNFPVVYP